MKPMGWFVNDTLARIEYEQWCSHNRKRKSESGWQIWLAAYRLGASSIAPGLQQLPENKQSFALDRFADVIKALSD